METIKKIQISLISSAIVLLIFVLVLICPQMKQIKKGSEDFITQRTALAESESELENFKKYHLDLKTHQSDLEKIDQLFVDADSPIEFIKFLEKTAQRFNLTILISAGTKQELGEDPWSSIGFKINLTGSFSNFLKFLEGLRSGSYLIEISNLDISRLGKEIGNFSASDVKANFSLKVYAK